MDLTVLAVSTIFQALVQLLMVLAGAAIIAAGVQGFKAEWRALFRKPMSGATARIFVYLLAIGFQAYNWYTHRGMPMWEVAVLAFMTAFVATGMYNFAKRN